MSTAPVEPPLEPRDQQLAQLLAEMTEQLQEGHNPDVDARRSRASRAGRRAA